MWGRDADGFALQMAISGFVGKCTEHCGESGTWVFFPDDHKAFVAEEKKVRELFPDMLVVTSVHSNWHFNKRTIASMRFHWCGRVYEYETDFGYGYEGSSAEYMFREGNYSCDCNRSLFIQNEVDPDFNAGEAMGCGDTIKMTDFRVRYE